MVVSGKPISRSMLALLSKPFTNQVPSASPRIQTSATITGRYLDNYRQSLEYANRTLTVHKSLGIPNLIACAESDVSTKASQLSAATINVQSLMAQTDHGSAARFIRAIRTVEGGMFGRATPAQTKAISLAHSCMSSNGMASFNPEHVLFVPENSWAFDLIGLHGCSGNFHRIYDESLNASYADLYAIRASVSNPLDMLKIVLHEAVHSKFINGSIITEHTDPTISKLQDVFVEAATEEIATALLEDILIANPELIKSASGNIQRFNNRLVQDNHSVPVVMGKIASAIFSTYHDERGVLGALVNRFDTQAIDGIGELLVNGRKDKLSVLFGNGYENVCRITDSDLFLTNSDVALQVLAKAFGMSDVGSNVIAAEKYLDVIHAAFIDPERSENSLFSTNRVDIYANAGIKSCFSGAVAEIFTELKAGAADYSKKQIEESVFNRTAVLWRRLENTRRILDQARARA